MIYDHVSGSLSGLDAKMIGTIPEGGNWRNLPESIDSARVRQIRRSAARGEGSRSTYYGRLQWDRPSYTVSTYFNRPGNGCFIHPLANRLITIREAARLQSFPDSYRFCGRGRARYLQVGNAVPPLLAYHLGCMLTRGAFVDLFSGAGGMSLGLEWAGFELVAAVDDDASANQTLQHNRPGNSPVLAADLSNPSELRTIVDEIRYRTSGRGPIALVAGGPPCQGFSTAGNCRLDDSRNKLVFAFVTAVAELEPKQVLMENVASLTFRGRRPILERVRTALHAPYGARSGTVVSGRTYPTNTWRNNFGIQKGVGCPAGPEVIANLLDHPQHRLGCRHMALDPEGRHLCRVRDTAYRGEEHAIWLRHSDNGYQVVDLNHPTVVRDYLQPGARRIPIFALIAMIYCMATPDVLPSRHHVGIPEFATDFGFTYEQIESLFDCDPDCPHNASLATRVEDSRATFVQHVLEPNDDYDSVDQFPEEPHDTVLNTGVGAEIIVAKDLQSVGWTARYRANQLGLGYDLEATRDDQTLRIEVKSSVAFANLELQESEWKAAQTYGDGYVLAVVDFYGTAERSIWYVRNPAVNAVPAERTTLTYRFVRMDVEVVKTEVEFL